MTLLSDPLKIAYFQLTSSFHCIMMIVGFSCYKLAGSLYKREVARPKQDTIKYKHWILLFHCGWKLKGVAFLVSQNTLPKLVLRLAVNIQICRKSNSIPCFFYLFYYLLKSAFKKFGFGDFPGAVVDRTLHSQCRGAGFDPLSGN